MRVYSQSMQMSIAPPQLPPEDMGTRTGAFGVSAALTVSGGSAGSATAAPSGSGGGGGYGANVMLDPPLSPSPVPLRGYAAAPLPPPASSAAAEREREYQSMMSSIKENRRQQKFQSEQDEDRRIERLLRHIESEEEFVGEVSRKLQLRDEARFKRKHELYKEWQDKVFTVVQSQIDKQLAALSTSELSARRRALFEDYIQTSNRKRGGLYRDIIIEADYDPMRAHETLMRYTLSDATDPLKHEVLVPHPSGKPTLPKRTAGRQTLDSSMWDKLHATPYGRFERMDAFAAAHPPTYDPNAASRVNFSHYNVSTDPAVLNREFPRGKRIEFGAGVRDMRASTIFAA